MGCALCVPKSLDVPSELREVLAKHSDIELLTETTDDARIEETTELIAVSFAGSTKTAPEGGLSYMIDPDNPKVGEPLHEPPSPERLDFFRFIAKWTVQQTLRHNGCFVLRDEYNKLLAATVIFLPNDQNLHDAGTCENIRVAQAVGFSNVPESLKHKGATQQRSDIVSRKQKESHHQHAEKPHIYVWVFAVSVDSQGRGAGRKLMEFITDLADQMNVDVYLETIGERNERFYSRNGFEIRGHYAIKHASGSLEPGLAAAVRPPSKR